MNCFLPIFMITLTVATSNPVYDLSYKEIVDLVNNCNSLKEENEKLKEANINLHEIYGKYNVILEKNIKLQKFRNKLKQKLKDTKTTLEEATTKNNALNSSYEQCETDYQALKSSNEQCDTQLQNSNADLKSSQQELASAKEETQDLEQQLKTKEQQLKAKQGQLNAETQRLQTAQTELDATKQELNTQKNNAQQLQTELDATKQELNTKKHDLDKSNKKIAELETQLTSHKETKELLKKSTPGGQSCQEILANGQTRNGVYTITGAGTPFEAYCNMDRGGYVVFQRRFDGSTDFNQNFQTYVNGFGSVTGEYWLGLEKLYQFTKTGKHKLRVDLVAYDGDTAYAIYEDFSIGVGPGYQLHIGKYSGTAGDSLTFHNNMKFTTVDNDADEYSGNCAEQFKGAFWYKDCHYVNINSFDYKETSYYGMRWYHFKGWANPMKETTMMVL